MRISSTPTEDYKHVVPKDLGFNLRTFVDFGLHKKWRTTSALLCKRAHKRANGRTFKKCSFGFFSYGALQPLDVSLLVFLVGISMNQPSTITHIHTY